jgi:hypothetical protein
MKRIKIIAGVTWAFLCLVLIIVLFPGLNSFSASASKLPFMRINPNYTGGEVAKQIISESCTLDIRRPVFDGLFKERKSGFVQMDWRGDIPEIINDTIDYNHDGIKDFCIMIDRKDSKSELTARNSKVKKIGISTQTSFGWSVRVDLEK